MVFDINGSLEFNILDIETGKPVSDAIEKNILGALKTGEFLVDLYDLTIATFSNLTTPIYRIKLIEVGNDTEYSDFRNTFCETH